MLFLYNIDKKAEVRHTGRTRTLNVTFEVDRDGGMLLCTKSLSDEEKERKTCFELDIIKMDETNVILKKACLLFCEICLLRFVYRAVLNLACVLLHVLLDVAN